MLIHSTRPDKEDQIVHKGHTYAAKGPLGTRGAGVFEVPGDVGAFLTQFPHFDHGDGLPAKTIVLAESESAEQEANASAKPRAASAK